MGEIKRLQRKSRGIRFSEQEWLRIAKAASIKGVSVAEFVRITATSQADRLLGEDRL